MPVPPMLPVPEGFKVDYAHFVNLISRSFSSFATGYKSSKPDDLLGFFGQKKTRAIQLEPDLIQKTMLREQRRQYDAIVENVDRIQDELKGYQADHKRETTPCNTHCRPGCGQGGNSTTISGNQTALAFTTWRIDEFRQPAAPCTTGIAYNRGDQCSL